MKNTSSLKTIFASLQWLFFIFANTVVVPVSIGTAFGLDSAEVAAMLRSSLIFTGLAGVLQGIVGHRFPLMEGHSGLMWGLILNLSLAASSMGMSLQEVGGGIASGILLAGTVTVVLAVFRLVSYIQKVFTPMVMTVYLFLLTFQLILIFFKGMLKVSEDGTIDLPVTLFSFAVVILVSLMKIKGSDTIGNFSILIGMLFGWIFYVILFSSGQVMGSQASIDFSIFPLGAPNLNYGIIAITFIASVINLSNTIASVQAAAKLTGQEVSQSPMDRSYLLTGIYSIGAAFFGLVPYAPFTSSVGFLESTRIFDRKPFLIGGGLMVILGIVPFLGALLATIPITVGNAVLFVAYLQLFGTSLKSLNGYTFDSRSIFRLAAPVLMGLSIMNLDTELFNVFPVIVRPLLSNGFIMGVLLSLLLETFVRWDKEEYKESKDKVVTGTK
ncbi:uracil/xanthine transporter [Mesobacillus jeotgali]|uniref:uracil/xanthine transporter n=1 Tax=Mesobacillus jeotgali TaxID=129985 RepID=UPI0009A8D931|nr:uracil/xanthine transporter [Mesobacillus jeotgali]